MSITSNLFTTISKFKFFEVFFSIANIAIDFNFSFEIWFLKYVLICLKLEKVRSAPALEGGIIIEITHKENINVEWMQKIKYYYCDKVHTFSVIHQNNFYTLSTVNVNRVTWVSTTDAFYFSILHIVNIQYTHIILL